MNRQNLSLIPPPTLSGKLLSPAIVFLAFFLISLVVGATVLTTNPTQATTDPVDIAVTIDPVISLTTSAPNNSLHIPIDPSPTGVQGSSNLVVSVFSNNLTGYQLTMNSTTPTASLTHTADSTKIIPTTTNTTASPATLQNNTWGYSKWTDTQVNSNTPPTTFSRIPSLTDTPDTLKTTTSPTETTDTQLTFAVRADNSITSGTYANTILFTAVTNYVPAPPHCPVLAGRTYLQEIKAPTGPIYGTDRERVVLKDRRNNQDYYVQNIVNQDGSCLAWMETNLRYAGDGDWDSTWNYPDDRYATSSSNATASTNDDTRPLTLRSSGYATHTSAEYMDPAGNTTLDTTTPTNNTTFYGYLYNWCTAMGGQANACNNTETDQANLDTTQSICPAGWRLPTGGASTNRDFNKLVVAVDADTMNAPASTNLRNNFLATYSGYYADQLQYQGTIGYYWSSTVATAAGAYYLYLVPGNVGPATSGSKINGHSVRCVIGLAL